MNCERQSKPGHLDKAHALVFLAIVASVVYLQLIPSSWTTTLGVVLSIFYAGCLVAVILSPLDLRIQLVAGLAGVLFWIVGVSCFNGKLVLFTALPERMAMLALMLIWHVRAVLIVPPVVSKLKGSCE